MAWSMRPNNTLVNAQTQVSKWLVFAKRGVENTRKTSSSDSNAASSGASRLQRHENPGFSMDHAPAGMASPATRGPLLGGGPARRRTRSVANGRANAATTVAMPPRTARRSRSRQLSAPKKLHRSWTVSDVMPRDGIAWAAKKRVSRCTRSATNRSDRALQSPSR
jgi:hypothetical protein